MSNVQELHERWQNHSKEEWRGDLNQYLNFISECLLKAELLLGHDAASEGLEIFEDNVDLKRSLALILNRMDMTEEAKNLFWDLIHLGNEDEETLGMMASCYKNLARKSKNESDRIDNIKMSIEFYSKAYRIGGNPWNAVNQSTMYFLLGDIEKSHEISESIVDELAKKAEGASRPDYWDMATLAEAYVILGRYTEAKECLKNAVDSFKNEIGCQVITRRNLNLLYATGKIPGKEQHEINAIFAIPRVVVFSGHMIDHSSDVEPRFPRELEKDVGRLIGEKVSSLGPVEVYASAACGADILFLEHVLKNGCKAHVILPCSKAQFIKTSVAYPEKSDWEKRFNKILSSGVIVTELTSINDDRMEIPYGFANKMIYGFAKMKAKSLHAEFVPFAVYNKSSTPKAGGTASVISLWRENEKEIEIIDLGKVLEEKKNKVAGREAGNGEAANGDYQYKGHEMGLLYADTVNYSRMTDFEMMVFGETLSNFINREIGSKGYEVGEKSTWGDAFFLSFHRIDETGRFALELMDFVNNHNWKEHGVNHKIKLRMALHSGNVYSYQNPFTNKPAYNGLNVCKAARIESITPPGRVFCSQEYAACLESQDVSDMVCSYVGQKVMPKLFGKFPTYLLRRV